MQIRKSGEDYLEAIYVTHKKQGYVRPTDVANYMGYSKASITHAVSVLQKGGFVKVNDEHHISLTKAGKEIAIKMYERHEFFKKHLISIGVDEETAEQDACRIEHAISDLSFEKLQKELIKRREER